jgi:hypothetical protein
MSVAKGPVKDAFIGTMTLAFGNMVKDVTGQDPTWSEPRIAPESERSGHG